MYSSGSSGKIQATAYLANNIEAKAKRAKREKVFSSKKAKKATHNKSCKEAVAALFHCSVLNEGITKKKEGPQQRQPTSTIYSSHTSIHASYFATPVALLIDIPCSTPSVEYTLKTSSTSSNTAPSVCTESFTRSVSTLGGSTPNASAVNFCKGCGKPEHLCDEVIRRDFCLQVVMDHFKDDNIRFTDELGVYTAIVKAYTFCVKKEMLDQHNFYERRREIEVPDCMVNGSLADAQALRTTDRLRRSLLGQRDFDVKNHLSELENGTITPSILTYDKTVREY